MADLTLPPEAMAQALRAGAPTKVASIDPSMEAQRAAARVLREPDLPQEYDHPPEEPKSQGPRHWTALDMGLEAAMAGASSFDAYDTNRFLRGGPDRIEENPLLGKHPDAGKLALATAVGQGLHTGISHALPHGWPRTAWQIATLLAEGSVIASNHGVKPFDQFWGWAMGNGGADTRRK